MKVSEIGCDEEHWIRLITF